MKSENLETTLIIFSCEGREHLIQSTFLSFTGICEYKFYKKILALDGTYKLQNYSSINPDLIVQNYRRKGYIQNILNALNLVDSEFFFWLEDDWEFTRKFDIEDMLSLLQKNPDWVQVRLSKTAPLAQEEKKIRLFNDIYESVYGFSANPCLCRTSHVKAGFEALQKSSLSETLGFENFLSHWFSDNSIICTVLDPEKLPMVIHSGYLESTPRQWHMTASLDGKTDTYLSAMEHAGEPKFWRKFLMVYKLNRAAFILSIRIFLSRAAYDLSFRISNVIKEFCDY